MSDKDFRKFYGGIYQTIDGDFHVYGKEGLVAHLLAVDSSYWEVSSTNAFENHMLEKYGKYVYGI